MKILHPHFTVNPCGFPVLNLPTSTFRQEPLFTWFPLSDSWFLRISACSSHLSQASGKRSCENLSWRLKGITFSALGFECSYLYVWISESFGCHCKTPSEITWMLMQLSTYEILKPPFTHCTDSLSVLPGIQQDHCSNNVKLPSEMPSAHFPCTPLSPDIFWTGLYTQARACIPLANSCRTYLSNKIATNSYIYKIQTCGIVFAAGQWHMIVQDVRVKNVFI